MRVSERQPAVTQTLPWGIAAGFIGLCFAGAAYFTFAAGSASKSSTTNAPSTPVAVEVVEPADGYSVRRRFVGQVESRRIVRMSFERSGRLARVLVQEGDSVAMGESLAQLQADRLQIRRRRLRATLQKARARRDMARAGYRRTEKLAAKDTASPQQLDEAETKLAKTRAGMNEARAQLRSVELQLEKSTLRAPFAGSVVVRYQDSGSMVDPSSPIVEIQDSNQLRARVGVPERNLDVLKPGEHEKLWIEGRMVAARVRDVVPRRSERTRTFDVLLDLPVDRGHPGDLVQLPIAVRVPQSGFSLPLDALVPARHGLWQVYVAEALEGTDGIAEVTPRQVTVAHQTGQRAYVQGTLAKGERVILTGAHQVVPGQRVKPRLAGSVETGAKSTE